jgi:hypothetical protein
MGKKLKKKLRGKKKKSSNKAGNSALDIPRRRARNRDIPVYDYLEDFHLDSGDGWFGECLDALIQDISKGYFLLWEAVVSEEQGLVLTPKQEEALGELISFSDDDDDLILHIDGMPRPMEPWYETVRKLAPKLILDPFETYHIYEETYCEGWSRLVQSIEEHGKDLSLPAGVASALDVIPPEISHRLRLQDAFDPLYGLGQEEDLTLENPDQKPWRIEQFIDALKETKESVRYFDLTLTDLFKRIKLPPRDENILIESMLEILGMTSVSEKLYRYL